ncbi:MULTISPECIES: hypothetical protein [Heyndrickxia]|nr:hypothetical protein [Heyndrickxia sporothermodurans]
MSKWIKEVPPKSAMSHIMLEKAEVSTSKREYEVHHEQMNKKKYLQRVP